jgi:outer membrane protein OmpA-like peptidoglycan-associated protein
MSSRALAVLGGLMFGAGAFATAQDVANAKDHPSISRYEGSQIIGYDFRKFDELNLPLSPSTITFPPGTPSVKKSQTVEGRVTRILYVAPLERSTLEVLRNYEQEMKKGGFQTLYACAAATCGNPVHSIVQLLYPASRAQTMSGKDLPIVLTMAQDTRYVAAKRSTPQGDTYASVLVAKDTNPGVPRTYNRTVVLLEIAETAPMDTGLVTVDAAAMAKEISRSGHVALYGIHFDTNKAELKPESHAAIQEIATLLKNDAALRLLVVGHTDNVGGFEPNVTLSERRADSVLKELVGKHGIAAARLRGVGVGMAAPVAPNDTEDGRAKNRRVELVKQ